MKARAGWTRTSSRPGTLNSAWAHVSGMTVSHCGHPTATLPYLVRDLEHEAVVDQGGRGFRLLEEAMEAAEGLLAGQLVAVRPSAHEAARALTRDQARELARYRAVHPEGERPHGSQVVRAVLEGGPLHGLEVELADGRDVWMFPVPREDRLAVLLGRGGLLPAPDEVAAYERRARLGDDLTATGWVRYHHRGAS